MTHTIHWLYTEENFTIHGWTVCHFLFWRQDRHKTVCRLSVVVGRQNDRWRGALVTGPIMSSVYGCECSAFPKHQPLWPGIRPVWRHRSQRNIQQSCCFVELSILSSATWQMAGHNARISTITRSTGTVYTSTKARLKFWWRSVSGSGSGSVIRIATKI